MKYLKFIFGLAFFSQMNLYSQNASHQTIDTLDISYMGAGNNQVFPEAIIHLKTWNGVSKVHCKIIDTNSNASVYYVSYNVSEMPVTNSNGIVLCLKTDSIIQIRCPNPLALKTYIYQIQTEDEQTNITTVYSINKELEQ